MGGFEALNEAVLIGGRGGFGTLFASRLPDAGVTVTTVDIQPGADLRWDVSEDPAPLTDVLARAGSVWLCLPEGQAIHALQALDPLVRPGQLVLDICSVKTRVCAAAAQWCTAAEYTSVHPMFGPERTLAGSNLVYMPVRGGTGGEALRRLLASWRLNIIDTDVETHDRVTSLVQVLTHAVLATFANARSRFDVPAELVEAFATPVFRDLEAVAYGMVAENPELYHNIQTANPFGDAARDKLRNAFEETLAILGDADGDGTRQLFERVRRP